MRLLSSVPLITMGVLFALAATPAVAQVQVLVPVSGETKLALELQGDAGRGKTAYAECQSCHRRDASGRSSGDIPRLSGQHASVIIKQIMDIRSGARINPQMKDFVMEPEQTPQTFADIAAYLQSLPVVGNLGKGPADLVDRGKGLYAKDCAACHGAAGEGRGEMFFPKVASQHYNYLLRELNLIRDGGRGNSNPGMALILKDYSADDRRAVAAYMAQLP